MTKPSLPTNAPTAPPAPPASDPSHRAGFDMSRLDDVPTIFFDIVSASGHDGGVGALTLEVRRSVGTSDTVIADYRPVAFLRCSMASLRMLRGAIDRIQLLADPTPPDRLRN